MRAGDADRNRLIRKTSKAAERIEIMKLGPMFRFFNIFAEKFSKKLVFLTRNKAKLCKNFDHNIVFLEKLHFFRRKLSKIAENCDHNIDPWNKNVSTGPANIFGERTPCKKSADLQPRQAN
jgi:hypothetical protein